MKPLTAVAKGMLAGAAGTGAMTAYQELIAKLRGGGKSTTPAEVGRRIIRGLFGSDFAEQHIELVNNVVHWAYGTGWGAAYGIVEGSLRRPRVSHGIAFGLVVWAVSLVELPAIGVAPPPREYPPQELALDASYHLVYGLGVGAAFAAAA